MDEFPRVHDFTEKTDRRSRGGGRIDNFNMYAVEKFANPSKIPSFDTIVRAELFLGLVSSPARYSNFVHDNSIREIIIFVTIVTKKKKKKNMAKFFYCHIIGLSFANKNCLYNLGKYHLQKRRNQHISGKSSQSYRLVVFLSRLEH